ncbi:hypothetical protein J7K06_02735 [Candidatus Bathyarchaeota archaeon]|nr:hypothetical protein [Candidatus Bathyarchaeota archaeon]
MSYKQNCKGSERGAQAPMVGEGKGKVVDRGKKYRKIFIYIPKEVAMDTSFPFEIGEDVTVRIEGERLIIEKRESKKKN